MRMHWLVRVHALRVLLPLRVRWALACSLIGIKLPEACAAALSYSVASGPAGHSCFGSGGLAAFVVEVVGTVHSCSVNQLAASGTIRTHLRLAELFQIWHKSRLLLVKLLKFLQNTHFLLLMRHLMLHSILLLWWSSHIWLSRLHL